MSEVKVSEPLLVEDWQYYETALMRFQQHVKPAGDGTFRLDIEDSTSIGIDPDLFEKLKHSLEVTNTKIRRGELDPKQVYQVHY
jgi:hypothetical protein